MYAQTVEDEARPMWASPQNIAVPAGAGPSRHTSYDTTGQLNTAFRNIVTVLQVVSRLPELELVGDSPRWRASLGLRALETLPIRWRA